MLRLAEISCQDLPTCKEYNSTTRLCSHPSKYLSTHNVKVSHQVPRLHKTCDSNILYFMAIWPYRSLLTVFFAKHIFRIWSKDKRVCVDEQDGLKVA